MNTPESSILIVDDNPANLGVLCDLLYNAGFEALVSQNGASALRSNAPAIPGLTSLYLGVTVNDNTTTLRVLIIEDDAIMRQMLETILRSFGCEVTGCIDAETAMAAYHQQFYPLIVLDLSLPGMNGFEFARHVRSRPQGDRSMILVITAHDSDDDIQAAFEAGADDYVTKPFTQKQLAVRLNILQRQRHNLLQRKQAEHALQQANEELEARIRARTAELQQAKEVAEAARRAAEAANRSKSWFLTNMGHELRTPLNVMLGYTKLLKHADNLETQQQQKLKMMETSGEHLLTLINDLLDFSKLETGHIEMQPQNIPVSPFLSRIINMARIHAEQQGLQFDYVQASDLPQEIQADPRRLRQVLSNLLDNAVKFTDSGGRIMLRVSIIHGADAAPGPVMRFECIDTGIGIAPERLQQIQTPFQPGQKSPYASNGMGFGLAMSSQLLALMHTELHVESTPGQGSRFWFDLPLPDVDWADTARANRGQYAGDAAHPGQPRLTTQRHRPASGEALRLPPELKTRLLALAERGSIKRILRVLNEHEPYEPSQSASVELIRELAENFQVDHILKLLQT